MNEQRLLVIALAAGIIGIVLLFLISRHIEINDTTIRKITKESADQDIKVSGQVVGIVAGDKVTVLTLKQESTIEVLMFGTDVALSQGDIIEVEGTVQDTGEQIVADKVTLK